MRIDIAAHILPTRYFARLQQIPGFYMAKRVNGIPYEHLTGGFVIPARFVDLSYVGRGVTVLGAFHP